MRLRFYWLQAVGCIEERQWPIDLRFPTNRSIGIGVGNLNLVREKEVGFPSQKRVGFSLSLRRGSDPNIDCSDGRRSH